MARMILTLLAVTVLIAPSAIGYEDRRSLAGSPAASDFVDFSTHRRSSRLRRLRGSHPRRKRKLLKSESISKRPNIVLIITDDQDVELGSLQFMPKLNRYLREEGAHFENGYVTTPMCCPSRSSLFTGLYVHNHNVLTNNDNCSSTEWIERHEPRTFAKYLQDKAGYRTGYFGKYLNKYDGNRIPEGWRQWNGLVRNSRFYNYTLNVNGKKVKHGFDYTNDYLPDLITNDSLAFFRHSKHEKPNKPVMMVMSYPGPHGPEDAAPQYSDLFFNVTTHHTPAYDYAPNPDKQWILQVTDRMEPIHKKFTDILMTKRLQTLQSIDEGIERLYKELDALGELDNTYIFYTSDHGYHLGQFGIVKGKSFPFEVDIKVPYFVRGPGIRWGTIRKDPVLNIDLAPTFLDIAGVEKPAHMDGRSIAQLFKEKGAPEEFEFRDTFLVERGKMTQQRFERVHGVRNETTEQNLLELPKVTKQERLAVECLKPRFQAPCHMYQKRKCVKKKNGDWKIKRCHQSRPRLSQHNESTRCHCQPGQEFGWKFLSDGEISKQQNFLARHAVQTKRLKFLDDVSNPDTNASFRRNHVDSTRVRREEDRGMEVELSLDVITPVEQSVDSVLEEIAEEEIDEVDSIMEDITDEIEDLKQTLSNTTTTTTRPALQCRVTDSKTVDCNGNVYNSQEAWRTSRTFVNEQIRRLRSQLFELKEIRKHLKNKRPEHQKEHFLNLDENVEDSFDDIEIEECRCTGNRLRSRRFRLKQVRREHRERLKLARLERRTRRKEDRRRRRDRKKKKEAKKKSRHDVCNFDQRLNCFSHDDSHWKTAPFWTDGPFCACTNSNTNTYSCIRTINVTHNFLYCEFVSGTITYYDLNVDPYQLRNIYQTLSDAEINFMHRQLQDLKQYSGYDDLEANERRRALRAENKKLLVRKQKEFIRKYGQYLPPPSAYRKRRRHHHGGTIVF